jgi:hypothetical protein
MNTSADGLGRLRVFLATSKSCFPGDARKVGIVQDRLRMYTHAVAQHSAAKVHKELLVWNA